MMKHLLTLLLSLSTLAVTAQPWNFVGSGSGISAATEVDIEITPNGQLYMAYIDASNSNKITVRKWLNQSWQLVGTAGIGDANVFDLQLVVLGESTPVVAAKTFYQTTYEFLEIYKFNGTSWVYQAIGPGGYNQTEHSDQYCLRGNTSNQLFLTFNNTNDQSTGYSVEGLITVNMTTQVMYGGAGANLEQTSFSGEVSSFVEGNKAFVIHGEADMSDYIPFDVSTGGAYSNYTLDNMDGASKMKMEKANGATAVSSVWSVPYSTYPLKFSAFNTTNNTFGTQVNLSTGSNVTDFDFDTYNSDAYVFYKTSTTCYFKKVTNVSAPSVSTISSGTSLAPANATSLAAEVYNNRYVIAYISGGQCYVKEYNTAADIDDYAFVQMCEGGTWDNNGQGSVYIYDADYSQANITMTCTSQNTAIIPQSAINISFDGTSYYYLTISNTNDVTVNTTIDLKWDLFEGGVLVETIYMPATVYNTPAVSFNFPAVQICENASPINLTNKATPGGGTWSGAGISGISFNPSAFNPSPSTSTYLVYTKVTQQGCLATDSILMTVNETPNLAITSTSADCNQANGTASVTISGGTPSYTSYWSNGSTFTSISDLEPGQYYFNTTDANGCIAVAVASVGSNGIVLSETVANVTCNGAATGGINLTVNGSNPPFAYAWSNGATTQDLSNVTAGTYEVTITDDNDCISTASYSILQPAAISLSSLSATQPACGASTGTAATVFTGGSQPYDYHWENAAGATIGTNSASISGLAAGYYSVEVTDDENCVHTETILIQNPNGPVIVLDTITPSDCSNNGTVDVIDISGSATYSWSNGASTQNLTNVAPGNYILEATSGGCVTMFEADVPAAMPEAVEICLVTVDTLSNTNLVVWEKPVSSTIDHFNIYRETSQAGVYQLAGAVPYANLSTYTDLVASPSVRSWRYKISSVDGCGVESELSDNHKTVHLVISHGLGSTYNLMWDSYEGFNYTQFKVYRHTDVNDWELLALMPTNLFSYTDNNPPSENELEYLVIIDAPDDCSATKSAQDFNTTRSNKDRAALEGTGSGIEELLDAQTVIYPSPGNGLVNISNASKEVFSARLLDHTGRVIEEFIVKKGIESFDFSGLSAGMYTIALSQNDVTVNKRFVIQK
jgi:hypothetical protein